MPKEFQWQDYSIPPRRFIGGNKTVIIVKMKETEYCILIQTTKYVLMLTNPRLRSFQ
jgi:hypothetical protein